jgi:dimeric dUTPase (all-alpha-NTP-PPase superfamily)
MQKVDVMRCKLREIWEEQNRQQVDFSMDPKAMSDVRKDVVSKELMLGLYEEVAKLARCSTHYKAHILKSPKIDKANVAEAVVDVLKYTIAIGQLYGLSDEDVYEAFLRKTEVIKDRAKGEQLELERNTKVLLFDVDNVIADLTDWDKNLKAARGGAVEGMTDKLVDMLESLKETFYREGGFLNLEPIPGAVEGLKELRSYGWKIVLITARPYWQYSRIYADTVCWFKKYGIEYDLLLFNKDKAEAIYEFIFPAKPAFLVEDREKHVIEVAELGVKVLLVSYPYNEGVAEGELVKRVNNWREIVEEIGKPK